MKQAFKIFLLILAIFPIWLTILAMGEESKEVSKVEALKARINAEFLKITDRHIQVVDIQMRSKEIEDFDTNSKLLVEISSLNILGNSTLVVKTLDASGRLAKLIRLPVKLFVEDQIAVANRDLARSEMITQDDVRLEWRDASQIRSSVIHPQDIKNQILKSNIKEGDVIYSNQLQKDAMVARGDRVKVRVVGTGITLTVVGQALEAGSRGQTIKVVNTDSRKEFLGVVTDSKEVEVRL